jgi:hypothetical protein
MAVPALYGVIKPPFAHRYRGGIGFGDIPDCMNLLPRFTTAIAAFCFYTDEIEHIM